MKLLLLNGFLTLLLFTSIFGYGPGSETLELWIRIRQKFRIPKDPDPQPVFAVPIHFDRIRIRPPKKTGSGSDLRL
jgi:hypothetical protein